MSVAETYRQNAITTQAPGQVVVMLYDGAVRFLKQALHAIESRDYARKSHALGRAQDVVFELNASLNLEVGGEVAQNLRSLYAFIWSQMRQINMRNDAVMLRRIIVILEDLSGAWRQAAGK